MHTQTVWSGRIFWSEITHLNQSNNLDRNSGAAKPHWIWPVPTDTLRLQWSFIQRQAEVCTVIGSVCLRLKASCRSIKAQRCAASKETTVIQANITITHAAQSFSFEIEMSFLQVLLVSAKAVFYLYEYRFL